MNTPEEFVSVGFFKTKIIIKNNIMIYKSINIEYGYLIFNLRTPMNKV